MLKALSLDGLSPCFGGLAWRVTEPGGELGPPDAELAVDVGKVGLDCAHAHVSSAAICLFVRPWAASSATRRSVSVSSS